MRRKATARLKTAARLDAMCEAIGIGPKKRKQPERALQSRVTHFLAVALPNDALCLAIPGGDREATRTPGYIAGSPDLLIVYGGRAFWIELKAGKAGRVSPAQAEMHQALIQCGCHVALCRSLDDVADAMIAWSVPLRARVGA